MNLLRHASTGIWGVYLSWSLSVFFALVAGYFLGQVTFAASLRNTSPVTVVHDSGSLVPTVDITSWKNGALAGDILGSVRLMVDGKAITSTASGTFSLGAPSASVAGGGAVPAGMKFVASKRGKKYYSVGSASARNLSEANKIYFTDAAAAEAAGFVK